MRAWSCMEGDARHVVVRTDYGFEYSDEDNQEEDVDIENQYYNSKGVLINCTAWLSTESQPDQCKTMFIISSCSPQHQQWLAGMLEDDAAGALKGFQDVVAMESEKAEW